MEKYNTGIAELDWRESLKKIEQKIICRNRTSTVLFFIRDSILELIFIKLNILLIYY